MGTDSFFAYTGTDWERTSKISVGPDVYRNKGTFNESATYTYHQPTDAEMALLLLHEYTHCLQGEMLRLIIVNRARDEGRNIAELDMNAAIGELFRGYNFDLAKHLGAPQEPLPPFHEIQANTIQYMALYYLNRLNNTNANFPGTRRMDPSPLTITVIKKINPNFENHYAIFLGTVMSEKNALQRDWVLSAVK